MENTFSILEKFIFLVCLLISLLFPKAKVKQGNQFLDILMTLLTTLLPLDILMILLTTLLPLDILITLLFTEVLTFMYPNSLTELYDNT
jgi:hypothetical protein